MRLLALAILALTLTGCGPREMRINGKWIKCKSIEKEACGISGLYCEDGINHRCVHDTDMRD